MRIRRQETTVAECRTTSRKIREKGVSHATVAIGVTRPEPVTLLYENKELTWTDIWYTVTTSCADVRTNAQARLFSEGNFELPYSLYGTQSMSDSHRPSDDSALTSVHETLFRNPIQPYAWGMLPQVLWLGSRPLLRSRKTTLFRRSRICSGCPGCESKMMIIIRIRIKNRNFQPHTA